MGASDGAGLRRNRTAIPIVTKAAFGGPRSEIAATLPLIAHPRETLLSPGTNFPILALLLRPIGSITCETQ